MDLECDNTTQKHTRLKNSKEERAQELTLQKLDIAGKEQTGFLFVNPEYEELKPSMKTDTSMPLRRTEDEKHREFDAKPRTNAGELISPFFQMSTPGVFVYWSSIAVSWVPNHRKV